MKIATLIPAAALALAGCAQESANNTGLDDTMVVDETADPATGNLTMESDPAAVDQAINQTDQQSDLGNAADKAVESAGNTFE